METFQLLLEGCIFQEAFNFLASLINGNKKQPVTVVVVYCGF